MSKAWLAVLVLAACTTDDPQNRVPVMPLDHAVSMSISVTPTVSGPKGLEVKIRRTDTSPGKSAQPEQCMRLDPTFALSANGAAGTIEDVGSFQPDSGEPTCGSARATIGLDPLPATIDLKLVDDTAEVHVILTTDGNGGYHVAQCPASACTAF